VCVGGIIGAFKFHSCRSSVQVGGPNSFWDTVVLNLHDLNHWRGRCNREALAWLALRTAMKGRGRGVLVWFGLVVWLMILISDWKEASKKDRVSAISRVANEAEDIPLAAEARVSDLVFVAWKRPCVVVLSSLGHKRVADKEVWTAV